MPEEKDFNDVLYPPETLSGKLLKGVEIRTTDVGNSETQFGEDSPTGEPIIFVNDSLYQGAAREKIIQGESLHLLKLREPELHKELLETARRDPDYMQWARRSYEYVTGARPDENGNFVDELYREKRSFSKWHEVSRFDQVLGGYIFAGDPDLPTMKNWDRDKLPIGPELRKKMEKLRRDFR